MNWLKAAKIFNLRMPVLKIQPSQRGLFKLMVTVIFIVLAENGLIFLFDFRQASSRSMNPSFASLPPSWVIGTVWVFLIAMMAYTYWILIVKNTEKAILQLLLVLFFVCIFYPVYTNICANDSSNKLISLMASLATIVLASFLSGRIYSLTKRGAWLIFLTALWVCFATFATYRF
jgi:tryptophan-rich sensory protein